MTYVHTDDMRADLKVSNEPREERREGWGQDGDWGIVNGGVMLKIHYILE